MSLFRTQKTSRAIPGSPSQLFHNLRRDKEIKFLWAHQERLLDEYTKSHLETPNIALELPTGSGKTLVGLLIAEFRRQVRGQRVVYLCPTRQLCNQVKQQADQYGIACSLLVGSKHNFDQQQFTNYQRSHVIAITTYSGIFNSSPGIDDPEVIICDDAHAGENFISSLWTLEIDRSAVPNLYQSLIDFFGDSISDDTRRRVIADGNDPHEKIHVDVVPAPTYSGRITDLGDLLDEHCRTGRLSFPWSMIRGHLEACVFYVSRDLILVRPVTPPTETHRPFSGAVQRVFMSATLGEGGDLERITGIRAIKRLPIASDWEKRNSGRRLILFPDLLTDDDHSQTALDELIRSADRVLVLVRDNRLLNTFNKRYEKQTHIILASDIEQDLTPFTLADGPTALVLANRYDGIDLPGDACRRLAMIGLPSFTNLQERFLWHRLGASSLLRDRTRTRISQGLGRCTRGESDYALVLMLGPDILKWCCTIRNTRSMNPDLQAEIAFGIDNSTDRPLEEFRQLCGAFFQQGSDWADANQDIIARREKMARETDDVTDALQKSVRHEIDYVYALWNHDFPVAHEEALAAADALSGGKELRPYRAFWFYMACVAANHAYHQTNDGRWNNSFTDDVTRATSSATGIQWLSGLRFLYGPSQQGSATEPAVDVDAILDLLTEWKTVGSQFEKHLGEARLDIQEVAAEKFERGLRVLGRMLGCEVRSWPDKDQGAPDCLWLLVGNEAIVFEAKSDESADDPVSLVTVRQALTHERWIRSKSEVSERISLYSVLVTPRSIVSGEAQLVGGELRVVSLSAIQNIFEAASKTLNSIRARARNLTDEALRELIDIEYRSAHLTHSDLKDRLLVQKVTSLPRRDGPSAAAR